MKLNSNWLKKKWVSYTIATCSAVMLLMILMHLGDIFRGLIGFFSFIKPVLVGIVIAYVINPLANFFDRGLFKNIKREKFRWKISSVVAIIALVACVTLLGFALVPQLVESVKTLFSNMDTYLDTLQSILRDFEKSGGARLFGLDLASLAALGDRIIDYLSGYFSENMDSFVTSGANFGKGIFDVVISFILAVYFLLDKRRITEGCGRLIALVVKPVTYEKMTGFFTRCNDILIRYISVDVIDGVAVGFVNFLFMIIMGMPYSALISFIVGITNLAPTFGPIVGAIIGAFILVLVNPWYALWFLIFTIVLQTVDGYILKPRLFGGSLGVSALMILISIILGGRLFGVAGILFAIPFAAIFDFTWRDFVIKKLEERHAKRYNQL
ncbi:AI-2E family transporter [Butyrivibrio sp. FCS014]|uniref:AI-2E family transporter n=1 Tax=Butyrivibrio sp. FCS014 TaxID=1408304 RepID=UPI000467B085|nr:AI-2E family transporter [Butyrivibrio sp. FCS014]